MDQLTFHASLAARPPPEPEVAHLYAHIIDACAGCPLPEPPLGSEVVDQDAVDLISSWIDQL